VSGKDYTGNGRKGQQKNRVFTRSGANARAGGGKKITSTFPLYSLDDLGDQVLNVDLELNDIRRQAFLETIVTFIPQKKTIDDFLYLDFETVEKVLGSHEAVFDQNGPQFFQPGAFVVQR
jgi:hypothetical protein